MSIESAPHWVYEFIARDGSHVYIGCTSNLSARLANHGGKDWWAEVARVEVDVYPNQRAGLDAERERIELYSPKYNHVFTDKYDAGGWAGRRAKMAAAHAAGTICEDSTCRECPPKAHALKVQCCRHHRGCVECVDFMPSHFYTERPQHADCWRELASRHGGAMATRLCWATPTPLDALLADNAGISLGELEADFREALDRAFVVTRRRAS